MAEELTSQSVAPEQPSPEQAVPASTTAAPQPETPPKESEPKPINLQEIPEFRNWQRQVTQTMERQRQQSQAEVARLKQELEAYATRGMTEDELSQHERRQLEQALEDARNQYSQLYQTYAKDLAMNEIARRAGVSPSVFAEAEGPDDAWEMALETRVKQVMAEMEAKYKRSLESSPGNSPDIGESKPSTSTGPGDVPEFKSVEDMFQFYRDYQDETNM